MNVLYLFGPLTLHRLSCFWNDITITTTATRGRRLTININMGHLNCLRIQPIWSFSLWGRQWQTHSFLLILQVICIPDFSTYFPSLHHFTVRPHTGLISCRSLALSADSTKKSGIRLNANQEKLNLLLEALYVECFFPLHSQLVLTFGAELLCILLGCWIYETSSYYTGSRTIAPAHRLFSYLKVGYAHNKQFWINLPAAGIQQGLFSEQTCTYIKRRLFSCSLV